LRVLGGRTDYSVVKPAKASPQELPTWRIPNVPSSAEAYYAPDNYHVIAQTQDPEGAHAPTRSTGALTWIFSATARPDGASMTAGRTSARTSFPTASAWPSPQRAITWIFRSETCRMSATTRRAPSSTLPTSTGEIASA